MKKRLLIIGAAGVRLRLQCNSLPYAGETADGTKYAYSPDCLAGAAAVAAAGMDTEVVLLTRVGADANGSKLISLLAEKDIDVRFAVKDRKAATSLTVVLEEEAADSRMIRYRGASENLIASNVETAFTCYPDGVLLRLEGSHEAILAADSFASEKDIPLYISAADLDTPSEICLPHTVHTFIADAKSVLAVTGIAPSNADSALRAAIELSRKIAFKSAVFRMNNGCIYVYDGRYGKILDKTSKGHSFCDVFAPAFACEHMKCGNILASAKFAAAAASLWEACGETFETIPTAAEVRRDSRL